MLIRILLLLLLPLLLPTASYAEDPGLFLLAYRHGPAFAEQDLSAHQQYLRALHDRDILLMGGPAQPGDMEFVVIRVGSPGQAASVAEGDPMVASGVLAVDVYAWDVNMSSMRSIRRSTAPERTADQPFRVERLDRSAPINIREQQATPR